MTSVTVLPERRDHPQRHGCGSLMGLPDGLPFPGQETAPGMGCVGPRPRRTGPVGHRPRTPAPADWGAWVPGPVERGLWVTRPARRPRPTSLAAAFLPPSPTGLGHGTVIPT